MPLSSPVSRAAAVAAAVVLAGSALVATPAAATPPPSSYAWAAHPTGSVESRLRGLSAVSADVAWAGGTDGTVWRTTDGGDSWQLRSPKNSSELQFRDVEAFDADHALVLTAGTGTDSRIYRTSDGGRTWARNFTNHSPDAFYDCMAFFDRDHGLALSDPVNGRFRVITTDDGGRTWQRIDESRMPPAIPGEFAFAASGTCLTTYGDSDAWIASGAGAQARVFHSTDRGRTWSVATAPVRTSESGGIFSVSFRNRLDGVAVGGDFLHPERAEHFAAWTKDGGATWHAARDVAGGYRSGSAYRDGTHRTFLAVGPTGSDVSTDNGRTWAGFDTGSFDAVDCAGDGACWASGEFGQVARLVVTRL